MLKPLIAATALLAIAGSSMVYAQQRSDGQRGFGNDGPRAEHRHRSPEDMAAFADARIAALKAGLELTPDQTKNWPPFEQALRDMSTLRVQRIQARQQAAGQPQQAPTSPFDRMSRRADTMTKFSAALKRVADTGAPLYMSLNEDQKGRFKMLSRMLRPHHRHGGMREGRRGQGEGQGDRHGGWQGHRFGQNGQRQGQEQWDQDNQGQNGFHSHRRGMNRGSDEDSSNL